MTEVKNKKEEVTRSKYYNLDITEVISFSTWNEYNTKWRQLVKTAKLFHIYIICNLYVTHSMNKAMALF